jgi:hypothetical protein
MKGTQAGVRHRFEVVLLCALAVAASTLSARAVLFKSTPDPSYNTNAPYGSLTNSGWQYEGNWGGFLGTAIAPRYFITATHVNGNLGDAFTLNGYTYHAISSNASPNADLTVWKVDATFPVYAPLYTNSNEVGKHCVVFGRGTQRGDAVILDKTNGWKWGASDGVRRWGENDVYTNLVIGSYGQHLQCRFDRSAGSNECHLSVGDSSGAMFVQDGSTWKLAGIHHYVDGPFSYTGSSTDEFDAALMDIGGLWVPSGTGCQFIANQPADIPSSFYSTRISANIAWINSVIDFFPGDDLQITSIQVIGNDVSVSFATTNRLYYVQRIDDLGTGTWTTFTNNVPGTGGIVSVLDPNAATLPQRFYRVGLVP